ncbi:MAG: hypothetical protein IJU98_03910, partial [Synergistaceae bacterium]|nr:hypothetical protein [Synergistaceae bacterium]
MDERALETVEKQKKSILYGGESLADMEAFNTTANAIREETQALPGVKETLSAYQTETLTLEYPALAGDINRALAQGWDRDKLRGYLAGREMYARMHYRQDQVDGLLGRTAETREKFWRAMKTQQDDAYVRIMQDEMSEGKVRDILRTAEITHKAPGLLLRNPELAEAAEKEAGERVGFFGQVRAAVFNAIAGHNQSSAGAERFEAQEMAELLKDRAALIEEGKRNLSTPPEFAWQMPSDDELAELGRKSLEKRIAEKKKDAATDEEDAMRWTAHVRPPDSVAGAFLLSAIESSGMTVMSAIRSRAAWMLGGPLAGMFMSLYNTYDESQREAGETFMTALRRGWSDEDAYRAAVNTRKKNLWLLAATNYAGDLLTFGARQAGGLLGRGTAAGKALGRVGDAIGGGVESLVDQWAGKITGRGLVEKLARGILRTVPLAAASVMEGFEESGQEFIKTEALGDEQDPAALAEAFRMGMGQSVIYSFVGLGGQKTLGAAWNKLVSQAPAAKLAARVEKEVQEAAELGEKLAKGEVKPDDIVGEDPVVFVPREALSEEALLELAGDEVLEEIEEPAAGEATAETGQEEEPSQAEEAEEDATPDELAVRQSTWDKWAKEHPEESEALKDHVRVGTRGVTAAEEFARKFDAVRKKAADKLNAGTPEAETARGIRDVVKAQLAEANKGLETPLDEQVLEDQSTIYAHMLMNTAANYNTTVEEVHRLRVKNGQDLVGRMRAGGERYWSPMYPNVTKDTLVPLVDLNNSFAEAKNLRAQDLLAKLKGLIQNGDALISSDSEVFMHVVGKKDGRDKARHLSFGSQKEGGKGRQTRNAAINSIEELAQEAVAVAWEPNTKKQAKPDVENYHYLVVPAEIGGKAYAVCLVTEELTNGDGLRPVDVEL